MRLTCSYKSQIFSSHTLKKTVQVHPEHERSTTDLQRNVNLVRRRNEQSSDGRQNLVCLTKGYHQAKQTGSGNAAQGLGDCLAAGCHRMRDHFQQQRKQRCWQKGGGQGKNSGTSQEVECHTLIKSLYLRDKNNIILSIDFTDLSIWYL